MPATRSPAPIAAATAAPDRPCEPPSLTRADGDAAEPVAGGDVPLAGPDVVVGAVVAVIVVVAAPPAAPEELAARVGGLDVPEWVTGAAVAVPPARCVAMS